MKRIGSLLTAGALALSLVRCPPARGRTGAGGDRPGRRPGRPDGRRGPEHPVRPVAGWEIILTGHAGNYSRTENRALTDDILYGVGSVSTTYTAAAVLKLVDEVELDAR